MDQDLYDVPESKSTDHSITNPFDNENCPEDFLGETRLVGDDEEIWSFGALKPQVNLQDFCIQRRPSKSTCI